MAPKCKMTDVGNSDMSYGSHKVLVTYSQKVNSNLTLRHNAYIIHLTSSHHVVILSSHIITRRKVRKKKNITIRYFERGHMNITFITVYCSILLVLVIVNILLYLICKLNISKKYICIGFSTICSFRHPLGVFECIPHR